MAMQPRNSAAFLADLDIVCPKADDSKLPLSFLKDLEETYAHALASSPQQSDISVAELTSLAEDLKTWRSHHQRLLQQYLAQISCDDPLRGQVSLFGTMDYGRLETAHTRTLAWVLDDREHGFGSQLLEALLRHLLKGRPICLTHVDKVKSEYLVDWGPTRTETGRIDVLAEGGWKEIGKEEVSWLLVIEAKIDAEESEEQLSQYDEWLKRCPQATEVIRVFLTPDGRAPLTSLAEWKWKRLSFVDLASVFRRVSCLQDGPGYHFLRYYLTGVLRDICGLPVPLSSDCENPYPAVDYLKSVLGVDETEDGYGQSR